MKRTLMLVTGAAAVGFSAQAIDGPQISGAVGISVNDDELIDGTTQTEVEKFKVRLTLTPAMVNWSLYTVSAGAGKVPSALEIPKPYLTKEGDPNFKVECTVESLGNPLSLKPVEKISEAGKYIINFPDGWCLSRNFYPDYSFSAGSGIAFTLVGGKELDQFGTTGEVVTPGISEARQGQIALTFQKDVQVKEGAVASLVVNGNLINIPVEKGAQSNQVVLNLSKDLPVGKYTVEIPKEAIESYENGEQVGVSKEISVEYTVFGDLKGEANPKNGAAVTKLSQVTLTFDETVKLADSAEAILSGKSGDIKATLSVDGTIVTVNLPEDAELAVGDYTLSIPAGAIQSESNPELVSNQEEISLKYTIYDEAQNNPNDVAAYNKFMNVLLPDLNSAYESAVKEVEGFKGVEGFDKIWSNGSDVFEAQKSTWTADLYGMLSSVLDKLNINKIPGAAEFIDGDEETVDEAIDEFEAIVTNWKGQVEVQNGYAQSIFSDLTELLDRLNAAVKTVDDAGEVKEEDKDIINRNLKEGYAEGKEKITSDLDAVINEQKTLYSELKLTSGNVDTTAISTDLDSLEEKAEVLASVIGYIQKYEAEKDKVTDRVNSDEALKPYESTIIPAFFEMVDFTGIVDFLKNIDSRTSLEEVEGSLDWFIEDLPGLCTDFLNVFAEKVTAYAANTSDLETFLRDKLELNADGEVSETLKDKYRDEYLQKTAFENRLKEICSGNNGSNDIESAIGKLNKLGEKFGVIEGTQADFEDIKKRIGNEISTSNLNYLKAYWTANEPTIDAAADSAVETLKSTLNTVVNGMSVPILTVKLPQFDSDVQTTFNNIKTLKANAGAITALYTGIEDLREYNNSNSYEPATGHFEDAITIGVEDVKGEFHPGVLKTLDDMVNAVSEAMENFDSAQDVMVPEGKVGTIEALNNRIDELRKQIEANNSAHANQLEASEKALENLDNAIKTLDDNKDNLAEALEGLGITDNESLNQWYTENRGTLETLRNKTLMDLNVEVADNYKVGNSAGFTEEYNNRYKEIADQAQSILDAMADDYQKAVKTVNNKTVEAAGWAADTAEMNEAIIAAINTYNKYWYGLKNENWKETLLSDEDLPNHETVYKYHTEIKELIAEATAYVEKAETAFTLEEFKSEFSAKAAVILVGIQKQVDNIQNQAATDARAFYATQYQKAQDQIEEKRQQLEAARLVPAQPAEPAEGEEPAKADFSLSPQLNACHAALEQAEKIYDKYNQEPTEPAEGEEPSEELEPLGIAMDYISDLLDKALEPVTDLDAVALGEWNKAYTEVSGNAADLLKQIDDAIAGTDDKNPYYLVYKETLETVKENVQTLVDEIKNLNDEAVSDGDDKLVVVNYANYKLRLMKLADALDNATESLSVNQENADAFKEYIDVTIPGLNESLAELLAYAGSLAGGHTYTGEAITSRISSLENFIRDNRTNLKEYKEDIDNLVESINNSIKTGYQDVAYDEQDYLRDVLLPKVQRSFNDAKAAYRNDQASSTANDEALNDWNESINEQGTAIENLSVLFVDFNKETFRENALAIEKSLDTTYVQMENSYGKKPLENAIANLERTYTSVKGQADTLSEVIANSMLSDEDKAKYEAQVEKVRTDLEAEKTAWEAEGDRLSDAPVEKKYDEAMANLADTLTVIAGDVDKANETAKAEAEKKAANQAAYDRLTAELDALQARYDEVKGLAEEYFPFSEDGVVTGSQYDYYLNEVKAAIDRYRELVENAYKNVELTEDTTLDYSEYYYNYLDQIENTVLTRHSDLRYDAAGTALRNVRVMLNGYILPECKQNVSEKLSELQTRLNAAYDKVHPTDPEAPAVTAQDLKDVIDEYNSIIEEASSLKTEISENTFVPGDVNCDPDGLVTAADVQLLLSWVLEDLTLEQVKEEYGARAAAAADLNNSGDLNITDVTMDIAYALGENPMIASLERFKAPAMEQHNSVALKLVGEENGVRRYALMLDNTAAMIGGQIDFRLPTGLRITDVETAERASTHMVASNEFETGTTRVALYSMDNAVIEGNAGAILYIDVEGKGDLKASDVVFTDSYFNTHELNASGVSLIDSIIDGAKELGNRIYDAAGVMYDKLQEGINIVRGADGKAKKEYHRKK